MKYRLFIKNGLEASSFVNKILGVLSSDRRFQKDEINPELVIIVGGDGTFLNAVQATFPKNKETIYLCFNAGTIGFYNDFTEEDVQDIPTIVYGEKYLLSEIDVLEAHYEGNTYCALNEFNLTGLSQNIDYDISLDGEYLEHYFGAGIIVSTASGSMAYNRSLNGAILDSSLRVMELTEVAGIRSKAHKTIGSPLVINANRTIHFKSDSSRRGYLYADGFKVSPIELDELSIQMSKKSLHYYTKKKDYFVDRIHKTIDL